MRIESVEESVFAAMCATVLVVIVVMLVACVVQLLIKGDPPTMTQRLDAWQARSIVEQEKEANDA